jgi:hypothetical protein
MTAFMPHIKKWQSRFRTEKRPHNFPGAFSKKSGYYENETIHGLYVSYNSIAIIHSG